MTSIDINNCERSKNLKIFKCQTRLMTSITVNAVKHFKYFSVKHVKLLLKEYFCFLNSAQEQAQSPPLTRAQRRRQRRREQRLLQQQQERQQQQEGNQQ